ncbi:hypothetical protein V6N13_101034 [Hibiscus sabdariffa]
MEGENLDRKCFCGARSSLTVGWKTSNPGLLRKIATMERERRNERTLLSGWGGHPSNSMDWWWGLACPWTVALIVPTRLSSKAVLSGGRGHPSNNLDWW